MRLGLDYGGTKIEGVVLDETGAERARKRIATPRHDYDGGIRAIRDLTEALESEAGGAITKVGIGVPGSVDRTSGQISLGNSTWLHGRDLRGDLRHALGRPVKIANDANCFALSEAVDGAGADGQVVFGIILGTGVGGGIVVNKTLLEGVNSIGGEWGHVTLPIPSDDERPGPLCSCGVPGHIEAWLSGPSLAADYVRTTGHDGSTPLTGRGVVEMASSGEAGARAAVERFEDRLGRSLAMVVNILDPDIIVMGGGLSNVARFYETVPPLIKPHVFGDSFKTRLVRNHHGDSSGVRGAAWL